MNTAYPLIPVSIVTIAAYFVTWLFTKWGMFPLKSFRKFWNYLLLVTFLVSGFIGLLSVVKINYKLSVPHYETYLKWHVAVGIGMVIISFFHLSWHLKYYFSREQKNTSKPEEPTNLTTYGNGEYKKYRVLIFLLGLSAIINQVVFIREFLSVMSGNELILGIVMASWLLLTALGAYTGRKNRSGKFSASKATMMVFVLPVFTMAMIGLLYWLKQLLFPPGTLTGVGVAIAGSFLLLFPVCFLSGYLFTLMSSHYSVAKNQNLISSAYAIESVGSLVGGLIFSLVLATLFNSFLVLTFLASVSLLTGAWILDSEKVRQRLFYLTLAVLIPVAVIIFNPEIHLKKMMLPNQKIVFDRTTPYGNLVVGEQSGQYNFYEDNNLQFYTDNMMENEEAVHFAMVQHPSPKTVLLISGGISGMIKEVLKYNVEKITYLESNPAMVKQWKKLAGINEFPKEVEFSRQDIRVFLQKNKSKFDVILLNLPPPSTLGINRFYTTEFFALIKKSCSVESVVCFSLPSTVNYPEKNVLDVNASLWKTMGNHFTNRLVLQGEKNYFLASDGELSAKVTALLEKKGIKNEYVNSSYFNDELIKQRSDLLKSLFPETAKVNLDFRPTMFISQIFHWLGLFGVSYSLLAGIPAIIFLLFLFRMNPVTTGLYIGGFTASSLEVTLMLVFQTYFGSIYLAVAFFFTAFMGGLAAGSWWGNRLKNVPVMKHFYFLQLVMAVFALSIPLVLILFSNIISFQVVAQFLFYLLAFLLAFAIGFEFYLASKLQPLPLRDTSGINYSADLAGSAFGAFLSAIVLLPILGLVYSCLIIAGLNVFSAGRVYISKTFS